MDLFPVLLGATCVLSAVAVVGHGIWVLVAWIIAGAPQNATKRLSGVARRLACPRCGVPLEGEQCGVCDWPLPGQSARRMPLSALGALEQQADVFHRLGILDPAAYQSLSQLTADERRRLLAARHADAALEQMRAAVAEPLAAELVEEHPSRQSPAGESLAQAPIAAANAPGAPAEFASQVPLAERAAHFKTAREQAQVPLPPARPEPRRTWIDWLAAFMEERNMRWGEMVGGLLIVCCSIALVISFWSAIAERPWLKFFLFNGVTAGLFGLGFYSEHRWRLHTTSQGLLIIASLLVPLNFLAIAAFSSSASADTPLTIVGEAVSVALFSAMVFGAGKILVDGGPAWLVAGLMVPSLAQLLVRRFVGPDTSTEMLTLLAALPLACYLVVSLRSLKQTADVLLLTEPDVNSLFKFFGLTSFAAVLPLALLLHKTGHPQETLRELPFIVGLLGLAPLGVGLTLWQKLAGRGLSGLRTAGTTVAVLGALVSLSGLVLGWPEPRAMLPAALVEFAIFLFVAWRFALPAAHLAAAACLAIGYLLGVNLFDQQITWSGQEPLALARALVSGRTGTLLVPLSVVYAAAAFAALRRQRPSALALAGAAGALATVSVALVSWFGLGIEGDPIGAGWVYLVYAAGFLAISARSSRVAIPWAGAALLLSGVSQELIFHYGESLQLVHGEIPALLLTCTLAAAIAVVVGRTQAAADDSPLEAVLWTASFFGSLLAAGWLTLLIPGQSAAFEARNWCWLAVVWFAVAWAIPWPGVWTLFQIALSLATVFAVGRQLQAYPWFDESRRPWLDPWTLQAVGIALAGLNLAWAVLRIACAIVSQRSAPDSFATQARQLLATPWLAVDRATNFGLVALLVVLSTYAVLPGVLQELSPRAPAVAAAPGAPPARVVPPIANFEWDGIPHEHAAEWGSWALLASVLVLLVALLRERASPAWLLCLFVALAASCPLLASRWESEVAAASALRWFSAAALVIGSAPVWGREWVARQAQRLGWRPAQADWSLSSAARSLVFFLGLFPPVVMALGIGIAALARSKSAGTLVTDSLGLWILGGAAVLLSASVWVVPERVLPRDESGARATWPWAASALLLVLGTAPVLSLVLYQVGIALKQSPILGPDPDSIFARMGLAGSYAAPILMTALVLVGYAVCERSSGFALAGGLVLNAGATAAYLLAISKSGLRFDAAQWIRLAQLNAAVAACYAVAWVAALVQVKRRPGARQPLAADFLLGTQLALAPALLALALGWAWCDLVWDPQKPTQQSVMNGELADVWGWASFALTCASVGVALWAAGRRVSMLGLSAFLVAVAIFAAALAASRWDTGNWVAYNTLLVGHGLIAATLLASVWREKRAEPISTPESLGAGHWPAIWVVLQGALVCGLSLRELVDNRWWPAGGLGFLGVMLAPAAACIFERRRYLYIAAALVNGAGLLLADQLNWIHGLDDFVYFNVILLTLPVVPWLVIELRVIRPRESTSRAAAVPFHRVATRGAMLVLGLAVGCGLYLDSVGQPLAPAPLTLAWTALAITAIAALASLWDVTARDSIAGLYVLGLVACGLLLDVFDLPPARLLWMGAAVTAAYALATSYLWSRRAGLLLLADRLRVPRWPQTELAGLAWLVPCNLLLAAVVVLLTLVVELTERDVSLRLMVSQATLSQAVSVALLARGDRRGILQSLSLGLGAVGAVLFAWSWLQVDSTLTLLHALVLLAAALAAVAVLYGFGLGKLLRDTSDWLPPARRLTPWLVAICAVALASTLGAEIYEFSRTGAVAIAWPAIVVVAVTLAGLCAAALAAAVLPGRDPLGLSTRGRTLYVYGAEVILALLFAHIRLTMPWLFSGFFQQYWPLVVMAIAFVGVGFAEICRRRKQEVLAEPIQNTGALLPVLPVLGFWAADTEVDYSLLLLSVGVLYTGLSIARRSFGFGVLAALAANGGLWYFLNRQSGFEFLAHPQIWLIPPALCLLAAAYLNRRQLTEAQMTAVRYVASMTIYISSTGDIFLNGVAREPYLALVLAVLSIVGILAGMLLRVRAFLFLGTGFLVLALFTIIWHAAVDLEQTWILWVSGIVLGLLIVALFALFEKKRQEVLEMVEKIKQWEG